MNIHALATGRQPLATASKSELAMPNLWQETAFAGMLLISLTDIYFPSIGLPILPMVGTAIFVTASFCWPRRVDHVSNVRSRKTTLLALLLTAVYCVSAIWGLIAYGSGSVKGALGMALGTLILTVVLYQEDNPEYREAIFKFCTRILVFHLVFWTIQFTVYILGNTYVDLIQPITGVPTRHTIGAGGIDLNLDRCSGLFGEPAIYATNIYFFVTARLIWTGLRPKLLDFLALGTMFASLSVTGILLGILVVVVYFVKALGHIRSSLLVTTVIGIAGLCVATLTGGEVLDLAIARLTAPSNDSSTHERFVDTLNTFQNLPESAQIFGIGVGNVEMAEGRLVNSILVPNGVMELLTYFGLIGLAVVIVLYVSLLRLRRVPVYLWLFLLAMLPGGTFFTISMWWLWQGMMVLGGIDDRMNRSSTGIVPSPMPAHLSG